LLRAIVVKLTSNPPIRFGIRRLLLGLFGDCKGVAATEFAIIVPVMLLMYFGTVEFSSGIAVQRKVTILARTLSDLTSQSLSVDDTVMANFFAAGAAIMTPYDATPIKATISELHVDPATLQVRVLWSTGAAPRAVGSPVAVPTTIAVANTYLIYSEVSYLYKPAFGYVMGEAGINLTDHAFTRPRQSQCVPYSPAICPLS
jgi:Flp pilus assembly protein TadG